MITIKKESEIKKMKEAGKILVEIMKELKKEIKPGIKTSLLEKKAKKLVKDKGLKCSFKGVHDYPACTCTSINEEIVHVPPSERKIEKEDLFSLDMGVEYEGYHSDMAFTVPIGEVDKKALNLMQATRKALYEGIKKIKPGNTLGDIGSVIEKVANEQDFSVVKELCGHGIGEEVHEDPQVLNFGEPGKGLELEKGMVICVEPMLALGSGEIERAKDGHGFKTRDGSLAAHFEHMIAVTKEGNKILTESDFLV